MWLFLQHLTDMARKKTEKGNGKERQRAYIAKLRSDPAAYEEHKRKDRERWNQRKESTKPTSSRNIRYVQRKWREAQRRCRQNNLDARRALAQTPPLAPSVPPLTPFIDLATPLGQPLSANALLVSRRKSGRKKVRRDRSAAYREIQCLKVQLAKERQRSAKYRKQVQRAKVEADSKKNTPRSKTRAMLLRGTVNPMVKKTLLFHNVLCQSIKDKYQITKSDKVRQLLANVVASRLLQKYKLRYVCRQSIGISERRLLSSVNSTGPAHYRRQHYKSKIYYVGGIVSAFLERDDNSRITTSKTDTITQHGTKKQRRLLTDTLTRLYEKFKTEHPTLNVSHSTFCSLRPFWIVQPSARDRETCLCKLHENGTLVISKLCQLQLLPDGCRTVETCVDKAVCTEPTKDCYERKCSGCANNLSVSLDEITAQSPTVWRQWQTVEELRQIKGKGVKVKRTIQVEHNGTIQELFDLFLCLLVKLCWHVLVIRNQFHEYHKVMNVQSTNACIIVVDYSENYTCKQRRAIQSAHFGASNSQISMHTGVAYVQNGKMSFCSLSDCTRHDPSAIWACLLPVLRSLRDKFPTLEYLHFWSDGPVTQYRNKHNLLFASQLVFREGFKGSTWNYFEAGHGKGAADAIGGVTKRAADRAVDHGTDIVNASMMYDVLKKTTTVEMFLVSEDEVTIIDALLPSVVKPVVGIMKVHQLQLLRSCEVSVRNLSCFCAAPSACHCYDSHIVNFPPIKPDGNVTAVTPLGTSTEGGRRRGRPRILLPKTEDEIRAVQPVKNKCSSTKRKRTHAPAKDSSLCSKQPKTRKLPSSWPMPSSQRPPLPRMPTWMPEKELAKGKFCFLVCSLINFCLFTACFTHHLNSNDVTNFLYRYPLF